jgi:hypothetical protein
MYTAEGTSVPQPKKPARKAPARAAARGKTRAPKTAGDYTAQSWAVALLERLGAPTTAQNIQAVTSWEAAEGGHWNNTAYYNPLNTTQNAHGATSMNPVGVKAYTSWQQGLDATVQTLENGRYAGILHALRQGNDANAVANAVVNSPWGTHQITVGDQTNYGTTHVDTTNRTVTSSALDPNKPQTVQQYLGNPDVASQYGYMAAYMKDPEVGPILAKAAQKGWNAGELLSALQKTRWWKKTSQTARQMQALQREDPASYHNQFVQQQAQVQALAQSMGITIPKARLNQLTTTALFSGWSNLQIQEAVGAEFRYTPGQSYAGTAGADIQKFKKLASDYLVPLSDQTVGTWTKQALQGKINPDDFTGYLAEQAKTLFPWMAHAIDGGVTPDQYLSPYRQAAAQTLELDPNAINFNDPKFMSLVQTVDPKTGQRTERGLANAMTEMRTNPVYGYDRTQGAKDQASAFAASLAHQFGYQGDPGSGLSGVSNPAA